MWPLSDEARAVLSTLVDVAAAPSIIINLFLLGIFLVRSYRPSSFFSGHWTGTLSDTNGSLEFFVVFYISAGQLVGQIYYQGQYADGRYVRGFDRLPNDTTRFRKITGRITLNPFRALKWLWRKAVGTKFEADLDRALHSIHNQKTGKYEFESGGPPYLYSFGIRTRFRHPRLTCTVSSRPDENGCARNFSGELVKQGGIPRFWSG